MLQKQKLGFLFSLLLLLPNFFDGHLEQLPGNRNTWDSFDTTLAGTIHSVNALEKQVDADAGVLGIETKDTAYLNILSSVVERRFYHGYSHYSLSENWMAAVAGKLCWAHLSAIVLPDDILKYPMASCSQQSLVVMALLRRKGISYRKVGFDHHFALEAWVNDSWYFIDTNMEPDFSGKARDSFAGLQNAGLLPSMYRATMSQQNLRKFLSKPVIGPINAVPAQHAAWFHRVTRILSLTLWLVPLWVQVLVFKLKRKQQPGL